MVTLEIQTLLTQHRYIRTRLLQLLKEIEDSGNANEALHFRIKVGFSERAHIGWQMLHCAATYDRYINFRILEKDVNDKKLVEQYGAGSVPDSSIIVTPDFIRSKLEETTKLYYDYFNSLNIPSLDILPHPKSERSYREILMILNWHEAEHMGQCQITWNTFKSMF